MATREDMVNAANLSSTGVAVDCVPLAAANAPSDSVDQPAGPFRALRATGAGNIQVTVAKGATRVLAFLAGETRYVAVTRVWLTNTTATGIEGVV